MSHLLPHNPHPQSLTMGQVSCLRHPLALSVYSPQTATAKTARSCQVSGDLKPWRLPQRQICSLLPLETVHR